MSYKDILKEAVEITKKLSQSEFNAIIKKAGLDKLEFDENLYIDNDIEIILPRLDSDNITEFKDNSINIERIQNNAKIKNNKEIDNFFLAA